MSLLAVAFIAATPASAGNGGKRKNKKVEVIHVELRQAIPFTFLDLDQSGSGTAGDQVIRSADHFRNGERTGTYDVGFCTIIRPDPLILHCTGTVYLHRGTITMAGLFDSRNAPGPHYLAITGGTRRYKNAHGHIVFFEEPPQGQTGRATWTIIRR